MDMFIKSAQALVLRDYQSAAIESARDNIRRGNRRQILCAPTGAGKTIIAMGLMKLAMEAGSRSAFITDRSALIDQTSTAMDLYGIDHGVMQATHWRTNPHAHVQLVSAQTLGRRIGNGGYVAHHLRDLRFVLIDECHTLYKSTLDWLKGLPDSTSIIGLTATPFTKGLGEHFNAIVNVATTDGLIASGALVKPVVYATVEADISGVPVKSTGEWDDKGLERAGVTIVGDVATEYVRLSTEHFGKPEKAIAFSSTVAHGEEICRAMASVGLNFQQISYLDDEDDRRRKIDEFRKPNSAIMGLVSCDALAKGFDVPDVKVCILCRPLRKSLTTHIQQIGRVMRPAPGKAKALVIDHTGNAMRFLEDTVDFWDRGVDELNDGAEKDKKPRELTETERKERACPKCKAVFSVSTPICPACGWERPERQSGVNVVSGSAQLLSMSKAGQGSKRGFDFDNHPILREPRTAYLSIYAWTLVRKRGDEDGARKWAASMYRGIYERWPAQVWRSLPHHPGMATIEVDRLCRSEMARFAKSRTQHAA